MTSELDIWRSAKLLVDQHGADAPIRAAQTAAKLLAAGDIERLDAWLRILAAIEQALSDAGVNWCDAKGQLGVWMPKRTP